jgi:hypothetical protein
VRCAIDSMVLSAWRWHQRRWPSLCVVYCGIPDSGRDGQARGQEAREPPTTRQGPSGEAEGAEESEDGTAISPGRRPHGAGPAPVAGRRTKRRRRTKSPANASAVHARFFSCRLAPGDETRVKSCGGRRHGNSGFMVAPWRGTKGVEPCAVQAARTVLNGGDEDTYRKATRLVPTQLQQRLKPGVRQLHSAPLGNPEVRGSYSRVNVRAA